MVGNFQRSLKRSFFCFCFLFVIALLPLFYSSGAKRIVIGSKNNTECHILSEMIALTIERLTDIKVVRKYQIEGSFIAFEALKSGDIDLYVEYTGTALTSLLKEPPVLDKAQGYRKTKELLKKRFGLNLLPALGFENSYTILCRKELGIEKMSEFAEVVAADPKVRIGLHPEFAIRPECALLKKHYADFSFQIFDRTLLYLHLRKGHLDFICSDTTDAQIDSSLVVLEDDRLGLPSYLAAPLLRGDVLTRYPELKEVFALFEGVISTEQMQELNRQVEKKKKNVHDVAIDYAIHSYLDPDHQ